MAESEESLLFFEECYADITVLKTKIRMESPGNELLPCINVAAEL